MRMNIRKKNQWIGDQVVYWFGLCGLLQEVTQTTHSQTYIVSYRGRTIVSLFRYCFFITMYNPQYIVILLVPWLHIVKTVYKRIFACKLTNNICVIILVRCCGPHWLQPDNIVPVRVRHVIHGGCGVDIKCPHGPSTCIYCRSHSIYDLRYDREAFSYIGCLDNHTWQFFAICCRIFMSPRLFPLVLRTKELLHWSVLPWPRRDTLRVCAYFPIGVLLIL